MRQRRPRGPQGSGSGARPPRAGPRRSPRRWSGRRARRPRAGRTRAGRPRAWRRPTARSPAPPGSPGRTARRGSAGRRRPRRRSSSPPRRAGRARRAGRRAGPRAAARSGPSPTTARLPAPELGEGLGEPHRVLALVQRPDEHEERRLALPADVGASLGGVAAAEALEVDAAVDHLDAALELGQARDELLPEVVGDGDHARRAHGAPRRAAEAREGADVADVAAVRGDDEPGARHASRRRGRRRRPERGSARRRRPAGSCAPDARASAARRRCFAGERPRLRAPRRRARAPAARARARGRRRRRRTRAPPGSGTSGRRGGSALLTLVVIPRTGE